MRSFYFKEISNFKIGDTFQYSGDEFHHLKNVVRLKINEFVLALNGQGLIVKTECVDISKKYISFNVVEIKKEKCVKRECILAQIKRESLELALRSAVELGVTKFHIVKTEYSQNFKFNADRLKKICLSAMLQSNNPFCCEIIYHSDIDALIKEVGDNIIVLDKSLDSKLSPEKKDEIFLTKPLVFIGPEGGFSESEIQKFQTMKLYSHSFNSPILRAETALIAAIAFRYL